MKDGDDHLYDEIVQLLKSSIEIMAQLNSFIEIKAQLPIFTTYIRL